MNICLCEMTKELARCYFSKFVADPALFMEDQPYQPYVYRAEDADARVDRYWQMGRIYLALMLDDEPIGEIVLKNIDNSKKHCTLGISLRSDEFKNKGYGTEAEIMVLRYAFEKLEMDTVFADSLIKNMRSQHVLVKAGFEETHRDKHFVYYRCDKNQWLDRRNC